MYFFYLSHFSVPLTLPETFSCSAAVLRFCWFLWSSLSTFATSRASGVLQFNLLPLTIRLHFTCSLMAHMSWYALREPSFYKSSYIHTFISLQRSSVVYRLVTTEPPVFQHSRQPSYRNEQFHLDYVSIRLVS